MLKRTAAAPRQSGRSLSHHPPPADSRPANKLLAALSDEEFDRIRPHLRTVIPRPRQAFLTTNEPVRAVVFLNGGVASLTSVMRDGSTVESAIVGREGVLGIEVFFGGNLATNNSMMQVPGGEAHVLPADIFSAELDRRGRLFDLVRRYSNALITMMVQSTGCMALHGVQERCCRWLLMTHDRVGHDQFRLSHEFLAVMLGSSRPTVSVVAERLQAAGLISYRYGQITILDRAGLERATCECYSAVTAQFDRLGV